MDNPVLHFPYLLSLCLITMEVLSGYILQPISYFCSPKSCWVGFFLANIHYQHDYLPLVICCLPLYLGRGMECLSKSLFTFLRTQKRNLSFKGPFELSRQAIQALYSVFHEDRLMLKQMTFPMPLKRKQAIFPIQPYVQACLICLLTALNPSLNEV